MPPSKFSFIVTPRFEVFYALQAYLDPRPSPAYAAWKEAAQAKLPPQFAGVVGAVGSAPALWAAICDTLRDAPAALDFPGVTAALAALPLEELQRRILVGLIHDDALSARLVAGELTLARALAAVPRAKQDWLAFIGLYPYAEDAPMAASLNALLTAPRRFRAGIIDGLGLFWAHAFAATWATLSPQLDESARRNAALFAAEPLAAFARAVNLRVIVSDDDAVIGAVRGGYRLPVAKIARAYFLPSLFNAERYWSAYEGKTKGAGTVAYFPYLDPAVSLDPRARPEAEAELDAPLLFRALGDSTRFAIARIIAAAPTTSVELAARLSLAKPTISHHIQILRAAGLITEAKAHGSVAVSLRRSVVERLSGVALRAFFPQPD